MSHSLRFTVHHKMVQDSSCILQTHTALEKPHQSGNTAESPGGWAEERIPEARQTFFSGLILFQTRRGESRAEHADPLKLCRNQVG